MKEEELICKTGETAQAQKPSKAVHILSETIKALEALDPYERHGVIFALEGYFVRTREAFKFRG